MCLLATLGLAGPHLQLHEFDQMGLVVLEVAEGVRVHCFVPHHPGAETGGARMQLYLYVRAKCSFSKGI